MNAEILLEENGNRTNTFMNIEEIEVTEIETENIESSSDDEVIVKRRKCVPLKSSSEGLTFLRKKI